MNVEHARSSLSSLLVASALAGCGGQDEPSTPLSKQAQPEAAPTMPAQVTPTPQSVTLAPTPAATSVGQAARQSLDDATITMKVRRALLADEEVKRTNLSVDTRLGVVTLRGTVGSQQYIERAVAIARTADGVTDVRSQVAINIHVPTRSR